VYTTDVTEQLSFALKFLRGLIDSYANETGRTVITNIFTGTSVNTNEVLFVAPAIPPNIFATVANGIVRFPTKAAWKISLSAESETPLLQIGFTDSKGVESGNLKIYVLRNGSDKAHPEAVDTFYIEYHSKIPVPVLTNLEKELPIAGYDAAVIEDLRGIALAQITQAESE